MIHIGILQPSRIPPLEGGILQQAQKKPRTSPSSLATTGRGRRALAGPWGSFQGSTGAMLGAPKRRSCGGIRADYAKVLMDYAVIL